MGYWKVIDNTPIVKNKHVHVLVVCKCKKEQLISLSDLKKGRATGCRNCKARERSVPIKIDDRYKDWRVINGPVISKNNNVLWEIRCLECNKSTRWIQGNELINKTHCFKCQKCSAIDRGHKQAGITKASKPFILSKATFAKIKRGAKARKYIFSLTIAFLNLLFKQQNGDCAITGDKLDSINKASLDRIDSSLGYIKTNVQWVTKQANLSKHIMSMPELIDFCNKVINKANQQPSIRLTTCKGPETNS